MTNDKSGECTKGQKAAKPAKGFRLGLRVRIILRRWGIDLAYSTAALAVIVVGAVIWYQPPLFRAKFPRVTYSFLGKTCADAELFRPLAMPTRYYVKLPHELKKQYRWFSVDRRREICAICQPPARKTFGAPAIRRSDPLGLDLEFRHMDNSEWRIGFFDDSIVFSNAVLCIRLDAK